VPRVELCAAAPIPVSEEEILEGILLP